SSFRRCRGADDGDQRADLGVPMNDEDDARPDDDEPDDPSSEESTRDDTGPWFGLDLPHGFTRSLLPSLDTGIHGIADSIMVRFREQMRGFVKAAMPNIT